MVGGITVVVGPGTTVPVGGDEDAVGGLGVEAGHDIVAGQQLAVIAREFRALFADRGAQGGELLREPVTTGFMGGRAWHTGTESTLCLDISHGRVGNEGGSSGQGDGVCAGAFL